MSEGNARIVLLPNSKSPRKCSFFIDTGDLTVVVQIPQRREWVYELYLKIIYRFGKIESIAPAGEKLYPPKISVMLPKDKIKVLNALRFVKSKYRAKLERLFEENYESFEKEVITLGISEVLGR